MQGSDGFAASISRLPPAARCDNCRRVVAPVKRCAIIVEGVSVGMRSLCTACLCHARDEFTKAAPWIDDPPRVKVRP